MKGKDYDFEKVEKGRTVVGQDLMRSLQKLAENKPVGTIEKNDEPEIRIRKKPKYVRKEIVSHEI